MYLVNLHGCDVGGLKYIAQNATSIDFGVYAMNPSDGGTNSKDLSIKVLKKTTDEYGNESIEETNKVFTQEELANIRKNFRKELDDAQKNEKFDQFIRSHTVGNYFTVQDPKNSNEYIILQPFLNVNAEFTTNEGFKYVNGGGDAKVGLDQKAITYRGKSMNVFGGTMHIPINYSFAGLLLQKHGKQFFEYQTGSGYKHVDFQNEIMSTPVSTVITNPVTLKKNDEKKDKKGRGGYIVGYAGLPRYKSGGLIKTKVQKNKRIAYY